MPRRVPVLTLALLLALAACGGDDEQPAAPPPGPEPAAEPTTHPATAMLAALARRVEDGTGISDETWTRDVQEVGMVLWPDDAVEAHRSARRDHTNLTHIAGDMAGKLAGGDAARADWSAHDPLSVRIHDGFAEAARGGVDAYRAWVAGGGRALLTERIEALQSERPPR